MDGAPGEERPRAKALYLRGTMIRRAEALRSLRYCGEDGAPVKCRSRFPAGMTNKKAIHSFRTGRGMDGAPADSHPCAKDAHGWGTRMVARAEGLVFRGGLGVLGHGGGDAVGEGDASGSEDDLRGFEAVAGGGDGDGAGRGIGGANEGGADGDAVDAALGVEVRVVGGVELAAVVAAAPDGGAGAGEVDARVVGGATMAVGVDDLEVDEGDVFAVGLETVGAEDWGELDGCGRTCRGQYLLDGDGCSIHAYGLDAAGGELDAGEGEDPSGVGLGVDAGGDAVDEELDRV